MTFLFDIGNVLLKLHFERFHKTVLGSPNASVPTELATLKDSYEKGEVSDEDFVRHSLNILSSPLTPEEFTTAWRDIFLANTPMWKVVEQLKAQNHRLITFSTTNNSHAEAFLADYSGFDHFDHHHFSHHVGSIKPDPAFYQKAVDTYKIDPAETFYFDDLPENIATGRKFGFTSWQYDHRDHQACLDWLASHKIRLEPPS